MLFADGTVNYLNIYKQVYPISIFNSMSHGKVLFTWNLECVKSFMSQHQGNILTHTLRSGLHPSVFWRWLVDVYMAGKHIHLYNTNANKSERLWKRNRNTDAYKFVHYLIMQYRETRLLHRLLYLLQVSRRTHRENDWYGWQCRIQNVDGVRCT